MGSVEEKIKTAGEFVNGAPSILLDEMMLKELHDQSGARKTINSKLWHACAGPLVSLPQVGSLVYYFPQGHSEQVAVSTKRTATSHIPNYPSLPSQLMCQVHNVTLHAEKDTDEIYAQMTLQPVYSEKDVLPIPHFGQNPSKHPSEFFCKTLTASDTSTHGGFSVPRRAAEKLFPTLDYSMQPPTQELVVRDLHDNSWTFRHIYRGQPKRHLLTTGWSVFVGAKRLRAGDSVLFIRDEKSQLLVGVRRANHQQTSLPSSVLSVDSMHIGVLAAAAHAAANRSPFTIFYNPRACPSEFVVPLSKCQKAIHGTQVTIGTRFGMMFETEESGKRRYMGTIVGISDLDPLRWPSSKWHNLQVEWDEPGSGEKQNRVSLWEIETPESLFIFPSLTSTLKRSFHPGFAGAETEWRNLIKRPFIRVPENGNSDLPYPPIPNLGSEQLLKMLFKPPSVSPFGTFSSALPTCGVKGTPLQARDTFPHILSHQKPQIKYQNPPQNCIDPFHALDANLISQAPMSEKMQPLNKPKSQIPPKAHVEKQEIAQAVETDQLSQLTSTGMGGEKLVGSPLNNPNLVNQPLFLDQGLLGPQIGSSQLETSNLNGLLPYPSNLPSPYLNTDDWMLQPSSCQSHDGMVNPIMPSLGQELWGSQMNYPRHFSQVEELSSCILQQDSNTHQSISNSCGLKDFSEESRNQSEIYNALHFEVSNGGSTIVDPSVSSTVLDGFGSLGDVDFPIPSGCFVGGFSSSQDVQSQITTASLADSQGFSLQEFPDNSGGTSSSNVDFDETNLFQKGSSWQQISQPMRTYTKVQKLGSVGRSIDVTRFKSYEELRYAIACMFGLKGLLDDPRGSEWKLVYVDYENDVLLVGDDPWEEFVTCVRCIKILSPSEVQQMSENGLELLNNTVV